MALTEKANAKTALLTVLKVRSAIQKCLADPSKATPKELVMINQLFIMDTRPLKAIKYIGSEE